MTTTTDDYSGRSRGRNPPLLCRSHRSSSGATLIVVVACMDQAVNHCHSDGSSCSPVFTTATTTTTTTPTASRTTMFCVPCISDLLRPLLVKAFEIGQFWVLNFPPKIDEFLFKFMNFQSCVNHDDLTFAAFFHSWRREKRPELKASMTLPFSCFDNACTFFS